MHRYFSFDPFPARPRGSSTIRCNDAGVGPRGEVTGEDEVIGEDVPNLTPPQVFSQ